MLSKSTNQASGKSIAFIDSQVAGSRSAIAYKAYKTAATVINSQVDRGDTSEETSTTEVIVFEVEKSSQTITVDVIGDAAANETITVTLSNTVASSASSSATASLTTTTIIDDEILQILSLIQLV
jgi:hypothetical protein